MLAETCYLTVLKKCYIFKETYKTILVSKVYYERENIKCGSTTY